MMRKMLTALAAMLTVWSAMAQNMEVRGKVTDAAGGGSVPFAAVRVQGTVTGTSSDADGMYTISVGKDAVLVFSSLGYVSKEVPVEGKSVVDVALEPDTEYLDETIVVSFGTSTKEAFTGSAAVVKASDITRMQNSEPTRSLEGLVAGVQMTTSTGSLGASPSIIIRGIGSMSASSTPLYVVDGMPYNGDLNNINPSDIESMTVQKDAASNSLYGARGANGVIMITTKKAKHSDAVINLDAKWGLNTRALQTYDVITDPGEYYEAFYAAIAGYAREHEKISVEALVNNYANRFINDYLGYQVYSLPSGEALIKMNGKLNPNAVLGREVDYNGNTYFIQPDNWLDEAYRNSLRQEYNLSLSGTVGKMSMYASFGYLNNKGIIDGADMYRYTARLRADYQARSWLKTGANISYTNFNWNNGNSDEGSSASASNVFGVATAIAPIYPLYVRDASRNIMKDASGRLRYDYGFYDNGCYRPYFTYANPVSDMTLNRNNHEGNAVNATGYAEISFLRDFKFTFNAGVHVDETRSTITNNQFYGQFASSGGSIEKSHGRTFDLNLQQLLSYGKTFAGIHRVDLLLGHEWQRTKDYGLMAAKSQLSSSVKDELNSAVIDDRASGSSKGMYNVEGFFFRGQYNLAEKVFVSASYRLDASSNFAVGNRWGHFWSLGAGWLLNRENWFNASWVDMLKVKASVGSQGNDGIGSYRYVKNYGLRNYNGEVGMSPESLGNPDVTWETNTNVNIGADFELFSGRLSGNLEYFYRLTSDMLYFFSLPMSGGYSGYYDNVGDMSNTGVELSLNGTILRRKNFKWDAYMNFTHYVSRVLDIPENNTMQEIDGHPGFINGSHYIGEGLPFNTFYLKKYAGVDASTGKSMWYMDKEDSEGNIVRDKTTEYSRASYYLCDTSTPDLYGGFGTSLSFHGVDVSVAFTYQIGGIAYDSGYASFMASPIYTTLGNNFHRDVLDAWSSENTSSGIPRLQYGDQYTAASSDRFLTDASYLNFQNAQIGYTLPQHITEKFHVSRLRVYVTCDNICYVSRRKGFDPRFSFNGSVNYAVNSPVRTISGGINLTF